MLEMLMQWYRRRFSDPGGDQSATSRLAFRLPGFGIMFFFRAACWPLLVAIVAGWRIWLEWPTLPGSSSGAQSVCIAHLGHLAGADPSLWASCCCWPCGASR
ncbi:hypothetical protein LNP74_19355 [Klebsiella pneumoniae subsp. pneumoniae]|nr:hypothetical protein [Klebsiella pneumoniae subsp. pneumoniae]